MKGHVSHTYINFKDNFHVIIFNELLVASHTIICITPEKWGSYVNEMTKKWEGWPCSYSCAHEHLLFTHSSQANKRGKEKGKGEKEAGKRERKGKEEEGRTENEK